MNAAEVLRQKAAELLALADELDGSPASAPAPDRLLDTSAACRLMRKSSSWLYGVGRSHPSLGWKLPTGSWVWSERALLAFRAGARVAIQECEVAANSATLTHSQQRTTSWITLNMMDGRPFSRIGSLPTVAALRAG